MQKLDKWIIGESINGKREYLIHAEKPRFIGIIEDNPDSPWLSVIKEIEWVDTPPLDAGIIAKLMREAGEALAEYDQILNDPIYEDEI